MSIWTDAVLDQYTEDGLQDINSQVPCIFSKFYLTTVVGQSVYTLNESVRSITRVTWRGRQLFPLSWEELQAMTPATVVVTGSGSSDTIEGVIGRPMWYALHPTNVKDIRLYPTPDEAFINTGDPYSQISNEARCCITVMSRIDSTNPLLSLPIYVARRTMKAYVLWKCFEKEGKGQDLKAAAFYKKRYSFLISQFKSINEGCFISKKYQLEDSMSLENRRFPRPMLPPQFERVKY